MTKNGWRTQILVLWRFAFSFNALFTVGTYYNTNRALPQDLTLCYNYAVFLRACGFDREYIRNRGAYTETRSRET